ncbi:hypothetical protein Tco_1268569, partial [Tanacetum coccineum]
SNDMVHNYYQEEAKKKAQLQKDKALNPKPSVITPARVPNTINGSKPKPRTKFGLQPYQFTYPERRLTMKEMLYKFIDKGNREHEEMSAFIKELRTTNELLFKERNNSLSELRLRKDKEEAQQRMFLENLKQLHINLPFIEALAQMPKYAKFLKSLLTNKAKLEEACIVMMNKRDESGIDSDLRKPIRRIDPANTPYSVTQETSRSDEVKSEHLYSASADEIDEKKLELQDLPHNLEYAYLHVDKYFSIIISFKLSEKEKMFLLRVLEKHRGAFTWKIPDIKGISPSFCTHKILMEGDFKPVIQP